MDRSHPHVTDAPQNAGLVALADRIELWPIDRLRAYDRNPRTHMRRRSTRSPPR
jgi:hypothetical protein